MQIVEYTILYMRITDAFDLDDNIGPLFVELVNKKIDKGWQPLGAPFTISEPDSSRKQINQTMVKYAEPPEFESIRTPHDKLKEIPDDIKE